MTTLYYFAGVHGLLVRNRKQSRRFWRWLLHKYGDGGVDLVQFDLMKSEVFMLAAYLKVPDHFKRSSI
jgi:NAD+ synthase